MNGENGIIDREKKELEAIIPEIETVPQAGGLIVTSKQSVEDIQFLADNIEKIIAAHNKIRLCILKLAQPGDWSKWGDTGEIGFAGANRIGATLGVNYSNWSAEKLTGHDDLGDWYRWEMQCDATFRSQTIRVYGRAGSRDKFFGFEHGKWKELYDTNEGNIKVAAMRAAKKEGVKDLFGLHGMDVKFLEANGIKLESAGGYTHKDPEQAGSKISDPQRKRLFAISQGKKTQDEVKAYLKEKYKIDSSTDIERKDYEAICAWVEGKAVAA